MKIIAIGCIHNDIEKVPRLLDEIKEKFEPDVIVSVGDVLDAEFPKGIKPLDVGKIFINELRSYFERILVTPGTWDKDLINYYKREKILVHGNGIKIGDVGFYGFGGAQTPFNTPYEPDEKEIYEGLKSAYEDVKNCKYKIQLTHAPPKHTRVDMIFNGEHVGSKAVREFIEEKQPEVAICAHIHEGRGIDLIGKTKILNVGKFTEGYVGVIEIKKDGNIFTDIVNLI